MSRKPSYEELEEKIRELERSVDRLESAEAHCLKIMDCHDSVIYTKDLQGRYTAINRQFEKLSGLERKAVIGKTDFDLFPESVARNSTRNDRQVIETKTSLETEEFGPVGDSMHLFLSVKHPLMNEDGSLYGICGISTDISEKKETEAELEQIFSMSIDMICIADIHTATFIRVNPAFTESLGFSESELLEKPFFSFIHPDDIDSTTSVVEEQLKKGAKVINFENRYRCKDGTYRWLNWTSHPNIEKGKTYAIARDITDKKTIEKKLSESKSLLDATGRMARVGGWKLDAETLEVSWTDETYRIHEVPIGQKPPLDEAINFFHPEDRERLIRAIENALRRGEPYDLELRFITAKGNLLWTRTKCLPEVKNGKTVRLIGTFHDITDRKNAEREILQQKQKAERYLNIAGVMFVGLDKDGNVTLVNQKACKVLGFQENEILGNNWFDRFVPQDIRADVRAVFDRLMQGDIAFAEYYESRVMSKSGKEKIIAWHNTSITDDDGAVIGILGSGEDLTEKKQLEAQLQRAQKMESIGTLAGGIAHDFNNILAPIIGLSELLLDDLKPETQQHENVRHIFQAGLRGKNLVNQILAFSRKADHRLMPVGLQHIVKEVLKLIRSTIPSYIEVSENIRNDCGPVLADAGQIHQVVMNLITNAYHAVEDNNGGISVRLTEIEITPGDTGFGKLAVGQYALLSISDTGGGIDPAVMDKIFEPYFTTKVQGKGTGLGLSVVYGIVKAHNGDVRVYSEPGKGTVFNVYLPLMEKPPALESSETSPRTLPGGTERILVVDDEEPIVRLQTQMLERLGYAVTAGTGSMDALEIFTANPEDFDLIIADMAMPDMTGLQLAEKVFSIKPDVPVIICTGFSERLNRELTSHIGIRDVLMKPIIKSELAKTVRAVLDAAAI